MYPKMDKWKIKIMMMMMMISSTWIGSQTGPTTVSDFTG